MTQNEQNFINKINEQADIIEWQKKAIAERDKQLKALQEPNTCDGCKYEVAGGYDCSHWSSKQEDCCIRFNDPVDYYEPKQN